MDVQKFYLFSHLDSDSAKELSQKIKTTRYKSGSMLFYKGEDSSCLRLLVDGKVKMYKYNTFNEEIIINYLKGQSLIGEMATIENIPYPANCMTETDSEIWSIKKDDLLILLQKHPKLSLDIIASMSAKVKILEKSIDLNISKNSTQRVATLIIQNKKIFEQLSRIKIASILNMKPETLSRIMKKLKVDGLIKIEKKIITICNRNSLENIMNEN